MRRRNAAVGCANESRAATMAWHRHSANRGKAKQLYLPQQPGWEGAGLDAMKSCDVHPLCHRGRACHLPMQRIAGLKCHSLPCTTPLCSLCIEAQRNSISWRTAPAEPYLGRLPRPPLLRRRASQLPAALPQPHLAVCCLLRRLCMGLARCAVLRLQAAVGFSHPLLFQVNPATKTGRGARGRRHCVLTSAALGSGHGPCILWRLGSLTNGPRQTHLLRRHRGTNESAASISTSAGQALLHSIEIQRAVDLVSWAGNARPGSPEACTCPAAAPCPA